jgi:quinol-cytochrome oxidoreductase complex cytochrome b subunit
MRYLSSLIGLSSNAVAAGGPQRIFRTLVFHTRPRMVARRTLRFTLTFGLGGMALVLVSLQLFSGILLKFAYEPFPAQAYDSLIRLQTERLFGQFMRNIHFWGANLLVGIAFLHGLRVCFTGAFRPPRRVNWLVGLSLFILVLASNLTGYLLPWDQLSFWATTICIGMLEYIPGVGGRLQQWVIGGHQIGPFTLRYFFALHTAVLPTAMAALMVYHFWKVRRAGGLVIPRPPGEAAPQQLSMVPGNPDLLLREAVAALCTIAGVFTLSLLVDAPLGPPANPGLSPNPTKAPWYFAGVQEMLVHFHPTVALVLVLGLALGAFCYPFVFGSDTTTSGVWFASAVGRRAAMACAALAALFTPLAVILDDYVIDFAGWLPEWHQAISNGLIPAVMFVAVLAGVYAAAGTLFRANRQETAQALVVFLVVMFVVLTLICSLFRGEGMKLGTNHVARVATERRPGRGSHPRRGGAAGPRSMNNPRCEQACGPDSQGWSNQ